MSSEVEAGGLIAAAVIVPVGVGVGVALGAGWLAWQGGRLLIEANRSADRQIAEKKRQLKEAEMHRKRAAMAMHEQMTAMCRQLLDQMDRGAAATGITNFSELERLRAELQSICSAEIPDDAQLLETLNTRGFLKLDSIAVRHRQLVSLAEEDGKGLYSGNALADLMDDLRIAVQAMEIQTIRGKDIRAADPEVLERVRLNEKLSAVTARVMDALSTVSGLTKDYGLLQSYRNWLHSCFNGVDERINRLYMPAITNGELKKGIRALEGMLEQYDTLASTMESDHKKFAALYRVYADASAALGEPVAGAGTFKTVKELEDRLNVLKERAQRAQECAGIYQKLGPAAYICYAWDQELRELGYSVHSRKTIAEMAGGKPRHARLGENKLPFYDWKEDDLTQLYAMTSECSLQVIVHEDGAVTMQTLSDADPEKTQAVQTKHCSLMAKLHENLRRNWFVIYDYRETASPEQIVGSGDWFHSADSGWKTGKDEMVVEQRRKERNERQAERHL